MPDPCWPDHFMKNSNAIMAAHSGENVSSLRLKMLSDLGACTPGEGRAEGQVRRLRTVAQAPVLASAPMGVHFLLWKNLFLVGSVIILAYTTLGRERVSIIAERKYSGMVVLSWLTSGAFFSHCCQATEHGAWQVWISEASGVSGHHGEAACSCLQCI